MCSAGRLYTAAPQLHGVPVKYRRTSLDRKCRQPKRSQALPPRARCGCAQLLLISLLCGWPAAVRAEQPYAEISFEAPDGLPITADHYQSAGGAPLIVMFHQAGWSRGEYREIAPRLAALGYSCLAVDLRSGGEVNGVVNETARRAAKSKLPSQYVDAWPDLIAALRRARELTSNPLIAWGSSYSASLALRAAGEHPELLNGVIAFAPGEYFSNQQRPKNWIQEAAPRIRVPVFISSGRDEESRWRPIYAAISSPKSWYLPPTRGNHGSRALWTRFGDSGGYWAALRAFLDEHFAVQAHLSGRSPEQSEPPLSDAKSLAAP